MGEQVKPEAQGFGDCPTCQARIPVYPHYPSWCDQCGWNLQPQEARRPHTLVEVLYTRISRTLSDKLYQDVRAQQRQRRLSVSVVLALALAAVVHGLTVACIVGGVFIIVVNRQYLGLVFVGLLLIATGMLLRPRLTPMPKGVVPRDTIPTLYRAADAVASAVGAAPVRGIIIAPDFNAAFLQAGFPRKTFLFLGLPLLAILDDEERVALFAHEMAHGANGDPRRGFFIGTAIGSLATWYSILRPDRLWDTRLRQVTIGAFFGNMVLLVLSTIPWSAAYVLSHLLWRDSQRAEYLADRLAARAAGTAASLRLLDKLHLAPTFVQVVQRVSLGQGDGHLFDELQRSLAQVPEREMERIRRVERLHGSRLDATHPPTAFRLDLMAAQPFAQATVTISHVDARRMEDELQALQPKIQAELVDQHRRSLYY